MHKERRMKQDGVIPRYRLSENKFYNQPYQTPVVRLCLVLILASDTILGSLQGGFIFPLASSRRT